MINVSRQTNPLDSPVERQNPVNDPQYFNKQGYSKYDLNFTINQTMRYADIQPVFALDTVSGDRIVAAINDNVVADQLSTRLMSEMNLHYDTFAVPLKAIYPMNWSKIIANPLKGNDVPDTALPAFPLYWFLKQIINPDKVNSFEIIADESPYDGFVYDYSTNDTPDIVTFSCQANILLRLAMILSKGSLLDTLGYSIEASTSIPTAISSTPVEVNNKLNFVTSAFLSYLTELLVTKKISILDVRIPDIQGSESNDIDLTTANSADMYYRVTTEPTLSSVRQLLYDAFNQGAFIMFGFPDAGLSAPSLEAYMTYFKSFLNSVGELPTAPSPLTPNLSRVAAYQMIYSEFYTADGVDNIFSNELYMQNIRAILYPTVSGFSSEPTFEYNGVPVEYDYFTIGGIVSAFSLDDSLLSRLFAFCSSFFAFRQSMRYRDFFSSARVSPLAVGDVTFSIKDNKVEATQMTEVLLMQRFLNAVNRTKNKLADYMTGIFGIRPAIEDPAPIYITHVQRKLNDNAVVNTAESQGAVTTNIDDKSTALRFDAYFDDSFVLVVNRTVEALMSYPNATELTYELHDRFQMFNPMLQNLGDEPIRFDSLSPSKRSSLAAPTFGYSARHSAYKFAISRSQGAFVDDIKGYVFTFPQNYIDFNSVINPDFLRERSIELDDYYPSLTGTSPSQYYHFLVSTVVEMTALRKMQALPPVLF